MKQKVLLNILTSVLPILALILSGCQGAQTEIQPYNRASTITPDSKGAMAVISIKPTLIDEQALTNCTYTLYYWQEHPETWPDTVSFGDVAMTKDQAQKWLTMENPDISGILFQQLFATLMNIKTGADAATIAQTIEEANNWLKANPPGSLISEFIQRRGLSLSRTLENFNNGRTGPQACANQPATPVLPTEAPPTMTSTAFLIETPLATETATPLPTSPPEEAPPAPQPQPPQPTNAPPKQPRKTATEQAPVKPTNTSAPPTKVVVPTNTSKPPTQPPPPTAIRATPTSAPPLPTNAP